LCRNELARSEFFAAIASSDAFAAFDAGVSFAAIDAFFGVAFHAVYPWLAWVIESARFAWPAWLGRSDEAGDLATKNGDSLMEKEMVSHRFS
jgi:hypothetical protein